MKIIRSLLATVVFVSFLLSIYYLHVSYFSISVVFYAALEDCVLAAFISWFLLFIGGYFDPLTHFEKILILIIWLLLGYGFAISVPTVIDRSLSFYILEKLHQRGGGIRLDRFEEVFTKEYLKEHHLIDVRLTEQEKSGTIKITHGCVKLTAKGEKISSLSLIFRHEFLPKKRILMGKLTDELTDPFRYSMKSPDYLCK